MLFRVATDEPVPKRGQTFAYVMEFDVRVVLFGVVGRVLRGPRWHRRGAGKNCSVQQRKSVRAKLPVYQAWEILFAYR